MDGQWHRIAVKGDKGKETSGSYRGYLDGRPNRQITNFREGETIKWIATGNMPMPENREALRRKAQGKRTEREADRERAYAVAAKKAFGVWENAAAATLGEASGHTAVCAFDAGNLKAVAEALRAKHPQRMIVLAADDDRAKRGRGNVGLNRARDAAQAVRGKVVEPGFTDADRAKGMTDFNDLARARGAEAVRAALAPALASDRERAAPTRAAGDDRALAMAR